MSEIPSFKSDKASPFIYNYLTCLDKSSIPDKQKRCYLKPIEEFITAHNGYKF